MRIKLGFIILQIVAITFGDICNKKKCSECIQVPGCAWCADADNDGGKCFKNDNIKSCNKIINPSSTSDHIMDYKLNNTFQLKPQHVNLTLRLGEEYKFKFQYRQSEYYPVDLYFLMDASNTMFKHKQAVSTLGEDLSRQIADLTDDFRIGFGTFVDKVILPFTDPSKTKNFCHNITADECEKPYSFKNLLPLNDNYTEFQNKVKTSKSSGNIDSPEGTLDALMQVIVCDEKIRWRKNVSRLIVVATDSVFHIAGDGKLAGIIIPNDGKCHTDVNGLYTGGLKYDYPSISHINYVAKLNDMNIIFAIGENTAYTNKNYVYEIYKTLTKHIFKSKFAVLEGSNIANLIQKNYEAIVTSVRMQFENEAKFSKKVKVSSITANCKTEDNVCVNVTLGETINFETTITAIQCNTNNEPFTLKINAGHNNRIIIDVNVICSCLECKNSNNVVMNATKCHGRGNLVCGVCECIDEFKGEFCEYLRNQSDADQSKCKKNQYEEVCSGKGKCLYGVCECNNRNVTNKFCEECDNCPNNDNTCGGHGQCECGICECDSGYTYDIIAQKCCKNDIDKCTKPNSNVTCSGKGTCNCGKCYCEKPMFGQYCDECVGCKSQLCNNYAPCVECLAYKNGAFSGDKCTERCSEFTIQTVAEFESTIKNDRLCTIANSTCQFVYQQNNDKIFITALKEPCDAGINLFIWIGSVIGSILLAGIICLLVWKLVTTLHDQREFAKFENERNQVRFQNCQNPLYKNATTTVKNPMFNRSSFRSRSSSNK